jgi:GH24 family phage-related lysozyme (muramidase)
MNPLIIKYEGCELVCYFDTGFVPTIGYGHTRGLTRADVGRKRITKVQAVEMLKADLPEYERIVLRRLPGLSLNRQIAMTSFVYNLGEDALDGRKTQIAKHINARRWQEAAAGMLFYIRDNNVILNGLIARRCEEASYLIKG